MSRFFRSPIAMALMLIVLGVGLVLGFLLGTRNTTSLAVLRTYPLALLNSEASTMQECVECHEPQDFHTCQTCHDDHGAIELTEVPFYNLILLTGDVPKPGYIEINQILPYREHPNTMISVLEFLAIQQVTNFEQIAFISNDGGVVMIEKADLNERAYLMPYMDGIRFVCEDLHVSTWLKGIRTMIVVGKDQPLKINGQSTSLGRLMMGPLHTVKVEAANVMLISEEDGQERKAVTALQLEGVALADVMGFPDNRPILVMVQSGEVHPISIEEARKSILLPIQGVLTLVFPDRGRAQWIEGVVSIEISR